MRSQLAALLVALACLSVSAPWVCLAQWVPGGTHVLTAPGNQTLTTMVPDGAGGVLLAGYYQHLPIWTIITQKVTAGGFVADGWPDSGLAVFALNSQFAVSVSVVSAPDGAGGAFIAWGIADRVYVQRVAASGSIAPGWPASGRDVITPLDIERDPVIASDGAGGALIAWNSPAHKVKVQHVAAGGADAAGWPAAGVNLTSTGESPGIADDGTGGAIVAWTDFRNNSFTGPDIYAQRLTASGAVAPGWPIDGVPLCRAAGVQGGLARGRLVVIPDGDHGAIVGWWDNRDNSVHPYAQRVLADGSIAPGWVTDGVALSVADTSTNSQKLQGVGDGSGGAIFQWLDWRNLTANIWGQRLMGSGVVASGWPAEGLGLCVDPRGQFQSGFLGPIISDGTGGAIVGWMDLRHSGRSDVYAIRVTGDGSPASGWSVGGNPLYLGGLAGSPFLAPDGTGGFIAAWQEIRSPAEGSDWFALHASGQGAVTAVPHTDTHLRPGLVLLPPAPNPSSLASRIQLELPETGAVRVEIMDLHGRRVRSLINQQVLAAGSSTLIWDGRTDSHVYVVTGVYFVRATFMGQTRTQKLLLVR